MRGCFSAARVLLLRDFDGGLAAVPLSAVLRVERISGAALLRVAPGSAAVATRGALIPVITGAGVAPAIAGDAGADLLVIGAARPALGLAATEALGPLDLPAELADAPGEPGVCGLFQHSGETVRLLDLGFLTGRAAQGRLDIEDSGRGRPQALLIDAEPITRDMLRLALEAAGCGTRAVDSLAAGEAALAAGFTCDVLIADLALAAEDEAGWRRLRHLAGAAGKGGIGVFAAASRAANDLARTLGLTRVVGKFDRTTLIATVRERLAKCAAAA